MMLNGAELAAALGNGWEAKGRDAVRGALTVSPGDRLYFASLRAIGYEMNVRGSDPAWCARECLDAAERRAWGVLAAVYEVRG